MKLPASLSLTARLALLFALMTASLLVVVGVVMSRAVEAHFGELDAHELAGKLALVGNLLQRADSPSARAALPQRLDDAFVGHDGVALLLRDADGVVFHAIRPQSFDARLLAGAPLTGAPATWAQDGRHFVGREAGFRVRGPDGTPREVHALVALDISHHAHFLDEVRTRLWIGISFAALVAALLGWGVAHKGLAPLRHVTATARRLSADRLGERLADDAAPAEVRELVDAFNGMLDRLESAFARLSDFSADLAHELRTPISNLMTQTEVALSRSRTADEYRDVLASNLEEYERIARMVGDMLFLAKAEKGRLPRDGEPVALAAEARALAEFYEALADERGLRITVAGEATVIGDRLMLRRALANLLSNALRHAAPASAIEVGISTDGHEAMLAVTNRGETLPPDQSERIFERFHRVGADRQRRGEGAGLGLAIVRSIVETHGGAIAVASRDGVTTFTIRLPVRGSIAEVA